MGPTPSMASDEILDGNHSSRAPAATASPAPMAPATHGFVCNRPDACS